MKILIKGVANLIITIKQFLGEVGETIQDITNAQNIIIDRHLTEELDTLSFTYFTLSTATFKMYSRVAFNEEFFNWHVHTSNLILVDKVHGIYEHTVDCVEITGKLAGYYVSNLAFNNFLTGEKLFANLYDVVIRINKLTPFELEHNIDFTRVITSIREDNDIVPVVTPRLKQLLIAYTDIQEFQFVNKSFLEVLNDIFILMGGTVRLVANADGDNILDINLFKLPNPPTVELGSFIEHSIFKDTYNYATSAEIVTNNVVDENSVYTSGFKNHKVLQTDDVVWDENLALFRTELPIYRILSVSVRKVTTQQTVSDATRFFVSVQEQALLNVTEGTKPSLENTLTYEIGKRTILGWGDTLKKNILGYSTPKWVKMHQAIGISSSGGLQEYAYEVTYIPLVPVTRFNIKASSYEDDNANASLRINTGDRFNQFSKLTKHSQNILSRTGAKQTVKAIRVADIADVLTLGTLDTTINKQITSINIRIIRGEVAVTYTI